MFARFETRFAWIKTLLLLPLVGLAIGMTAFFIFDWINPFPPQQLNKAFSQLVVDRNGKPLRAFADSNGVWRYPTTLAKVSPLYIDALINYEDRRFWQHKGVNTLSMLRAIFQWLYYGKPVSGGSTISMQVARILEPHQRSIRGKLWQILRTTQLEWHLNKEEILTLYLNYAPYGGPVEGIEAATFTYLGKSAKYLTHAEAALMAVLPQRPSALRPDRFPQRAELARNKVLKRLSDFSVWSTKAVEQAFDEPVVAMFHSRPLDAPLLSRMLVGQNKDKPLINSTIDKDIQILVADEIKEYLYRFSENTSASALLLENQSMNVLAYVGAADFGNPLRHGHVDMNRAIRSPGSTLKPFIFGMALDEGLIHSQSLLQDVPLTFDDYAPENFTKNYSGAVSAEHALQQSLNLPAVQLLKEIEPVNFAEKLEGAGLKLFLPGDHKPSLSIALGGAGIRLVDLAGAYRALARDGIAGQPRFLKSTPLIEKHLLSKEAAWITANMLSKVPLEASQTSPFFKRHKRWLAHKTGTSYGYRDAWMAAVSRDYTLIVWVGKPDGTPSPGEFGRRTAGPLVNRILNVLPNQFTEQPEKPENVVAKSICWPMGKAEQLTEKKHCHEKKTAWTIDHVTPSTLTTANFNRKNPITIQINQQGERVFQDCVQGVTTTVKVALWPPRVEHWLPKNFRASSLLPPLSSLCRHKERLSENLVIVGVKHDSRISLPPSHDKSLELSLSVLGGYGEITWLLNGELVEKSSGDQKIQLGNFKQGENRIVVLSQNGQMGELSFYLH